MCVKSQEVRDKVDECERKLRRCQEVFHEQHEQTVNKIVILWLGEKAL